MMYVNKGPFKTFDFLAGFPFFGTSFKYTSFPSFIDFSICLTVFSQQLTILSITLLIFSNNFTFLRQSCRGPSRAKNPFPFLLPFRNVNKTRFIFSNFYGVCFVLFRTSFLSNTPKIILFSCGKKMTGSGIFVITWRKIVFPPSLFTSKSLIFIVLPYKLLFLAIETLYQYDFLVTIHSIFVTSMSRGPPYIYIFLLTSTLGRRFTTFYNVQLSLDLFHSSIVIYFHKGAYRSKTC